MKNTNSQCDMCKRKFPSSSVKCANNGKNCFCHECYDRFKSMQEVKTDEKRPIVFAGEIVKLMCGNCRYKFSYRKGSKVKLACPYCGSTRLMRNPPTAERMVKEAAANKAEA